MASARFAWGIDIGNRALKAIRLSRGDSGLRIDDFEVIEHENVLSNAGDNKESLIQSALANFVQRHSTKGGVVAISVSGVTSFARFIKLPPVEARKIPEIVRFEAIQQIPFPLDDVEWSYQLFQTPDSPDVEVGIFAMRRELINQHIKHFTDVDLNVQYVQMNPLAVYNAMYYDGRLKGTTMIIDLGAENTDLIIADGETIWLRSIPIGGNNFTEVLVKSFKLPFVKAEELKRNAATSKYARQIFQAMRPVFADLVAEVQRSMGFYASVHRDSRIKKIIALGGTFRLPGLQKYLQQNLQLDVERMDRLTAGSPADGKLATTFNENLLSLVSAYGLAIQAMGEGKITSSLLPLHIRREKMWRDKTKYFGAAAGLFVLGTAVAVGAYYTAQFQHSAAKETFENNSKTLKEGKTLDSAWKTQIQDAGAPQRLQITNVRSLLTERNLWPSLISDIFAQLPPVPPGMLSDDPAAQAQLKAVPRDHRNVILIDKIESVYSDNLLSSMAAIPAFLPNGVLPTAQAGGGITLPPEPNIPPGSRGYILTITLTTPHDNGYLYVLNNFKPKLEQLGRSWMDQFNLAHREDKKDYYIAKVSNPIGNQQLKDDQGRLLTIRASYNAYQDVSGKSAHGQGQPPGGMPPPMFNPREGRDVGYAPPGPGPYQPGMPVGPPGSMSEDDPASRDRITDESRLMDWEMKLDVVVVVAPPEKAPAQ